MYEIEKNVDIEKELDNISYEPNPNYIPSKASIKLVELIKLINKERGGESNNTPLVHYYILDNIFSKKTDIAIMSHRGIAKSTLIEYLIWYIAIFNEIPNFGSVPFAIYISDSIENGVKTMRQNLDNRYENSLFLKEYIPKYKSTETSIIFKNKNGNSFILKLYGAKTGVRGARALGSRPVLAIYDDLIQKEEDARSKVIMDSIRSTVYSDVEDALDPTKRKQIWLGTPFNSNDPLYQAIESGAWSFSLYPVCEKFPCDKKEFRGSWEDRFSYNFVKKTYEKRKAVGQQEKFYRELMLRVASMEDLLINDDDIVWFSREKVLEHKDAYNFVITTDFATSEKTSADYSVILVWAINSNEDYLLVDGYINRSTMSINLKELFRFATIYKYPIVGIETYGTQKAYISLIYDKMLETKVNMSIQEIRPNKDKLNRLMAIEPKFKMKKIWFAKELKDTKLMKEIIDELHKTTKSGIKAKHDDALDCISMLAFLDIIAPSSTPSMKYNPIEKIFEEAKKSNLDEFGKNLIL